MELSNDSVDAIVVELLGENQYARARGVPALSTRPQDTDPMDPASLHRWFKKALMRAGLPALIKIHELRHSAADNLYRETGNVILAQQLLRHESVATTQSYLHPVREDLAEALASLHKERQQ